MNVLISGASMAGLCAAYWFARHGHRVTVVERADGLRLGGAPIDIRGRGLETAKRMGILDRIDARKVSIVGPAPVLDATGQQVASTDLRWFANQSEHDIEIGRDRLNRILLDIIPEHVELRYKASIASIADGPEGADVVLTDGYEGRFELVVGADGLHSNVRKLAFGPEKDFVQHFGHYVALVDLPTDREWQRAMLTVPGLTIAVRDAGDGPQAFLLVASHRIDYDYRDISVQRSAVDRFLSRVDAWQVPALRAAFADPGAKGFYFDSVSQTHMPQWIKGHCAVIGDAGHCASLLSGMGTTLAMVAAELLANTWTEHQRNLEKGWASYHEQLRPYVDWCQAFALENAPIMVPPTQEVLDERNRSLRAMELKHTAA